MVSVVPVWLINELPGSVSSSIHLAIHCCSAVGGSYVLHIGMAVGNGAGIYLGVGSIFEENAMAGRIGDVYRAHRGAIAASHAKETAAAVAGIHLGAGNVGAIAVGHAESSITAPVVVVVSGYSSNGTVL